MKIKASKNNENLYSIEDLTFEDVIKIRSAIDSAGIETRRQLYNLKEQIEFLIIARIQAKKR